MSEHSANITFVIFTFNEEQRLGRAISNFCHVGRVLVVDNESSDRTRAIAIERNCDFMINKNTGWVEDEVTTDRVKAAVKTPWIYWGFADEMVDVESMDAILAAVASGMYDIVSITRKNYYYGEFCYDLFVDRMNRIFKKDAIDFTGNTIHHFGRIKAESRVHSLPSKYFVHHFISHAAKSYLGSLDRYTDLESKEEHSVPGVFRLLLSTVKMLFVNVLVRKGYRSGRPGAFLTIYQIFYRWVSAMKLYEKTAGLNQELIEVKNDVFRDRILQSFSPKRN